MIFLTANARRFCTRTQTGSQIVEFSAALILLVFFAFIPLLDLTIVPIRWMLAQELVNEYARKLALCESFHQSYRTMAADPSLSTRLHRLGGVYVQSLDLRMRISRVFNYPHAPETLEVADPTQIPADWLPDGAKAPCAYSLELNVSCFVSPAILLSDKGMSVPGLTKPFSFLITATHEWENVGRDPVTGKFFLNE